MAKEFYKEKEHAFTVMEKDLKSGEIPNIVLLCGSEDYLINFYSDVLINRFVSDACRAIDLVIINGENLSLSNITESLETVSLMSSRKVVYLPDFLPAEGKNIKGFTENDIKGLIEYLGNIPGESMLLMSVSEQDDGRGKKSKLKTAIEKHGKVYDFQPLKDKQLHGFIEKRLRASGKYYRPSVVNAIISGSGYGNKAVEYSLYNLNNDLRKIVAHSGEEITETDVSSVLSVNPENDVFAMLDAIGRNRKGEALKMLHNLLESGTPVYNLLRLITGQLELILSVKEMKEEGFSMTDMQKKMGVHQFRVKKAYAMASQYSAAYIRTILSEAYDVDENIKKGLFEDSLALEYFIAKL